MNDMRNKYLKYLDETEWMFNNNADKKPMHLMQSEF